MKGKVEEKMKKGWMEEMVEVMDSIHVRVKAVEVNGGKVETKVDRVITAMIALQKRVETLEKDSSLIGISRVLNWFNFICHP